jgi:hypothetical protein
LLKRQRRSHQSQETRPLDENLNAFIEAIKGEHSLNRICYLLAIVDLAANSVVSVTNHLLGKVIEARRKGNTIRDVVSTKLNMRAMEICMSYVGI